MENASKAVIMAGSVLIAIIVISITMYVYSAYQSFAETNSQKLSISQISSFNRFYESYSNSTGKIRGIDVINIYNRVADDAVDDYEIAINPPNISAVTPSLVGQHQAENYLELYDYDISYDSEGRISRIEIN